MSIIDLASLKSMLRSVVVSSPTQVNLHSLIHDYSSLVGEPLPFYQFGYNDPLTFLKELCSDCFQFQGDPSNPILTLIVPKSLQFINKWQSQKLAAAKKVIGKRTSIPDTSDGIPTVGGARKCDNESGSSSSPSNLCTCTEQQRLYALLEPRDIYHSSQDNRSYTHTSSQRSTKRAQLEDQKDEKYAVVKDSKDRVSCKIDPVMCCHKRSATVASIVQTLGDRLHITGNAARGDMLLQDAAAASPRDHVSRVAHVEHALPGVPYAPDVFPTDCLQFEERVPHSNISMLQPGHNIDVIVGEVYSPSHFWLIRLGPHYETAMDELVHEMTEYFERGEGRERYLARAAVRIGQHCAAFYDCYWHRAIIIDVLRGDLVKVRHVDYGTVSIVPAATLRPFLRRWAWLPKQALRARLAGVRPAWGGQGWSHAATEYFLRQVDDRSLNASIVAINAEEAILEVFLVDTNQEDDVDLTRDMVRAGFADVRRDSALRVTRAEDRYLYPSFSAIERGLTPYFDEIQSYVLDNISLGYVSSYRRHVVSSLLSTLEPTITPLPSPSLKHVPLIRPVPPSPRPIATAAPRLTATPAPRSSATPAPWPTATAAARPTATPVPRPTAKSAPRLSATPAPWPTATAAPRPTATPAPRPTATPTPRPNATPASRPTATPAPRPTVKPAPRPTTRPVPRPTATPVPRPPTTLTPGLIGTPAPPRLSSSPGRSHPSAMLPPPYVISPPYVQYGMPPLLAPYRFPGLPYGFILQLMPQPLLAGTILPRRSPPSTMPPSHLIYYLD